MNRSAAPTSNTESQIVPKLFHYRLKPCVVILPEKKTNNFITSHDLTFRPGAISNPEGQRTNPDLIPDSESCVVESDLESESCRFESESCRFESESDS